MRTIAGVAWPAAAVLAFQLVAFPVPLEVSLQGVVLGLLNAMVVLGLTLVYRANRVVNLAQASIGTFPAALAGGVVLFGGTTLVATGALALAAGLTVLLGGLTVLRLRPVTAVAAALAAGAFCAAGLQAAEPFG